MKSRITELSTKINSGTASLEGLGKIRENNLMQYKSIKEEIHQNQLEIQRLKRSHKRTLDEINRKQSEHDALAEEAVDLWENISEHSRNIREIEQQLDKNYERLTHLRSETVRSREATKIRKRRIRTLSNRRQKLLITLGELEKSLDELKKVQKEQKAQLKSLDQTLQRRIAQKETIQTEIDEAGKIAESAREAVVEFATQRELAETVAAEEKALRSIEELGDLGVIPGVYGRLRNLIKIQKIYRQAIEAAAAGWLDALVVKNLDSAFTCTETLRKMKLGRIKIIPTEGVSHSTSLKTPEKDGVNGTASVFVRSTEKYRSAVEFVFGDTLIASNDKTALALSSKGYRTVTVNGDIYEAGGGLESGYYRAPIDFSKIIPSETAIKNLDEAVSVLQQHLLKRSDNITFFEEDIDRTRVEIARLSEAVTTLDREIARINGNVKRTKKNVRTIDSRVARFEKQIQDEKAEMWIHRAEGNSIRKKMQKLQRELADLRRSADPTHIQQIEITRERLAEKIMGLRQALGTIRTKISTLQSKYDNVLKTGRTNARIQFQKVNQQLGNLKSDVESALQERSSLSQEVAELEKTRIKLSETVFSARKEAKKFTSQIDNIDEELHKLDSEYEPAERLLNQLQLKIQTSTLQVEQHRNQLRQFGCEHVLNVTVEQVEEAETSTKMMQLELERIGAVNQLALSHYNEQISRYRELSIRLNELETEKQAIVQFMDEIEQKKRRVFMEAFEKIRIDLQKYFSKVTGGGNATLKLEDQEDPFSGGINMIVEFPNKPSIVVSGASGGERSVAAVAFIFALKDFTPASFYILDEIDAHLDAFHVSKLADLLLEEAKRTQFMVVTLKPETVNKAERIYGVYMRNGVSHVVPAKFLEVSS